MRLASLVLIGLTALPLRAEDAPACALLTAPPDLFGWSAPPSIACRDRAPAQAQPVRLLPTGAPEGADEPLLQTGPSVYFSGSAQAGFAIRF